ncbi:MinD/ParA family ATP-binding protein [Mycolicibacterium arenosum]|uniref:MinD/ParA family protein n=1 Tax=Mycolicibacterium arenosum TaxID=2952157 RepID=A0ABT1MFC7_9MYCO|nr:MinD/ParA family protein [Mycolicibacterium sp. CAU 1645]MCP9276914.1 MinD/ParA family protein [Mycolicibacterium sp. CAU 1645]
MSDNHDFRSRYTTGLDTARAGGAPEHTGPSDTGPAHAAPAPVDPFAAPGAEEATQAVTMTGGPNRHAENERTTVVDRADVDAALASPPAPEPSAEPATGSEQTGGPEAPPTPTAYWLNGSGGRNGYDSAAPRPEAAGPGLPSPARPSALGAPPPAPAPEPNHYPPAAPGYPPPGADPGALRHEPPPPPWQPHYPGGGSGAGGPGVSVGEMRARIRESQVAPPYKPVPQTGWRKGVYKVTRINLGLSATERHWNDLARRLKVNLRGKYVIAVMGVKGGASKTTSTICLGGALSRYRTDKIVAVDANPASGNLARRVDEPVTLSWRGLIEDRNLQEYTDFRSYLGRQTSTGLEVLSSDVGDQMMSGQNLLAAVKLLQKQYPIALLDCGNQLRDELTYVLLHQLGVDAVVVPSTTRLDGAQGAAETLNWLMTHGFPHLVREAVVVVSNVNRIDASAQVKGLHEDFARSVRAVHDVPFDQHLSDAVAIDFERLRPDTRQVYIEAAASLVDGFASAADRDAGARWGGPAGGRP